MPPSAKAPATIKLLPAKVLAAFHDGSANGPQNATPRAIPRNILVSTGPQVAVPSFTGAGLRSVVIQAEAAGLHVQPVGSGVARDQAPAAGTMVPQGSEVVVRFLR